jgi:hypothetical protein
MSTDENPDIATIASEPNEVTLEDGTVVSINRLKTREMMSLLKILTRGAGAVLGEVGLSSDMEPGEFTGTLLSATVLAIPEAEDEAIEFVNRMVSPTGIVTARKLSKPEQEINEEKYTHLAEILDNPEIIDLITIISKVVEIEAPHIQSLGKSLAAIWKVTQTAAKKSPKNSSKSD